MSDQPSAPTQLTNEPPRRDSEPEIDPQVLACARRQLASYKFGWDDGFDKGYCLAFAIAIAIAGVLWLGSRAGRTL